MKPTNLLTLIGEEPKATPNYIITNNTMEAKIYPKYRAEFADFMGGTLDELNQEIQDLESLYFNAVENSEFETACSIQFEIQQLLQLKTVQ